MSRLKLLVSIGYFVIFISNLISRSEAKALTFEKIAVCDPKIKLPVMIESSIRQQGKTQYVDANLTASVPFGQNQTMLVLTEFSVMAGVSYILFNKDEKPLCEFLQDDFKLFWDGIQRCSKINSCPVKTGRYEIKNFNMDLNQLSNIENLVPGKLRVTMKVTENGTNRNISCFVFEMLTR